ncbi:fumarylacetoacetate hydrolase family protein [Microbacterium gallinarum]|uniref:Fumarylacetoacetate hydrolase family protein n=1 Tax=Microbacterium gallinarum TaxID=2762209 RepID=A0ABR8X098_9MICO|nr:fumarylacetoacetate hydrolase family protein [Microbacterium gallinarum]MBD8022754.1 fumarylacetoacetate hydrolase family protein [Microbacterium gallinarum]
MRVCVYDDDRVGALASDSTIVDLTDLVPGHTPADERMNALIANWDAVKPTAAERVAAGGGVPEADAVLRAPQPRPRNLFAAPVNYHKHQQEMGGDAGVYVGRQILTAEVRKGFLKAATSIVGPDGAIELPWEDRRFDHEAEIGVIIGKKASRVSTDDALDYVFGYTPLLDITLRGEEDRSFRKSFDTFTPIGPYIVTADEVDDPEKLDFWLTVNGEERQKSNTSYLIYGIAKLIEVYSEVMTLQPGDIIATGTPEGVGQIVPGDTVVLTIPEVGELTMPVVARA